ncbi:hypothetical protein [Mucilaginibacter sp. R-33]
MKRKKDEFTEPGEFTRIQSANEIKVFKFNGVAAERCYKGL